MNWWVTGGLYLVAVGLGLLSRAYIRTFQRTGAGTYLFLASAGFGAGLSILIKPFAERGGFGAELLVAAGAVVGFSISLALAWRLTLDSGVLGETRKGASLVDRLLGRSPYLPRWVPPTTSRRTGILFGLFFTMFGLLHHFVFPPGRLFYTFLFMCTGLATLLLSVLKLR